MSYDKPLIPTDERWMRNEPGISAEVRGFGNDYASIRIQLNFSKAMEATIPERCDVFEGDGEQEGSVLLHFHENGSYKILHPKRVKKSTVLRIPLPPCVPRGYQFACAACRISWQDKERLVVWLPIKDWKDTIPT